MADRLSSASLYRADLLLCLHAIVKDQHDQIAQLLGFIEEVEQPLGLETELHFTKLPDQEIQPFAPSQPIVSQTKAQGSSYYRVIERQVDADKIAQAQQVSKFPEWFNQATPSYFKETETRIPAIHQIKPVYLPLISWPRLWPLLMRVLGADIPGSKPDIDKLVETISLGQQIRHIPKTTRYTWSENIKLLIDIHDGNFAYRQDFIGLQQQLQAWRGSDGFSVQFVYDEPGGYISQYESGKETIEPWRNPELAEPLLILSDLAMHTKSRRRLYQWLVFGQRLNLNGIRATVLMPVAEREIDRRLLRYFDCVVWDGNSTLKPVETQYQTEPFQHSQTDSTEKLLALLFPALRVELGLLRAVRQLLPANDCDVSHEAAVWHHAAVIAAGDEWGWQAASRSAYQQKFLTEFRKLSQIQQQKLLEQLGIYHAQLPDELYFEAMHQFIRLDLPVPEEVKQSTWDFMSMLVKTYYEYPQQSLELWVKRILARHDNASMYSEHLKAFMAIERNRTHQREGTPIQWPAGIDSGEMQAFIAANSKTYFLFLRQTGMELELFAELQPIIRQDDWSVGVVLIKRIQHQGNLITLSYPGLDGQPQLFTLNLETDTPYRFSLPPGLHQLEIGEEKLTIEVQSAEDKPAWVVAKNVNSNGLCVESCSKEGHVSSWYWHPPEIDRRLEFNDGKDQKLLELAVPGFWYFKPFLDASNVPADWSYPPCRDQYGLYVEVELAGVIQRFRWIQPGSFLMGSPEDEKGRFSNETQHHVILNQGYWFADTACSQALWQAVMGGNPSKFKGDNRPVENVSWNDAQQFIQKLNQLQYNLNLRLPSEAEWEYACRAGTTDSFNFAGELSLTKVNYQGHWDYDHDKWRVNGLRETAALKRYPANQWGLYEMHGNVWEWCEDWYGEYTKGLVTDPEGADTGSLRVLRGGSWNASGRSCRSAVRFHYSPDYVHGLIGFRLARGHQPGQISTGAGQQPDGTRAAAARGAQPGDGLRDARQKSSNAKTGSKKSKNIMDNIKDFFKK